MECVRLGFDLELLMVDPDFPLSVFAFLNLATKGAGPLKTDEDHVRVFSPNKGFEVVNDPTTGAHATASDNDRGFAGLQQVVDCLAMVATSIDLD